VGEHAFVRMHSAEVATLKFESKTTSEVERRISIKVNQFVLELTKSEPTVSFDQRDVTTAGSVPPEPTIVERVD
jgi:hypothetical protein